MSVTGNSEIKTGGQPPATPSGKDSTVRTLNEPPDIWELVHETREEFKPGSAFVGHLKALHPLVLFMILLLVGGGGVFGFMKFRSWSGSSSTAPPVPTETSKSVLSPPAALPNQTSTDQSTTKAPAPTAPVVNTVAEPKPGWLAASSARQSRGHRKYMMDEIEGRVLGCFANVFPGVSKTDLPRVNQASLAEWDSVLHVTLLASLAEEFDFEIDYEAAEDLRSFALVVDFVRNHAGR